jgi:hypothetical protein
LKVWADSQWVEASRKGITTPHYEDLVSAARRILASLCPGGDQQCNTRDYRDGLLFLDAVLTGQGHTEIAKRTESQARSLWPESLHPLLLPYLRQRGIQGGGEECLWLGSGGQPLSAGSIRAILQRVLVKAFDYHLTPKQIEEAWCTAYSLDHPEDLLTLATHRGLRRETAARKLERIKQRRAIARVDASLQGGAAPC